MLHVNMTKVGVGPLQHEKHTFCRNLTLREARMKLTLPKLGLESPLGLPKFQSLIVGVKTLHIGVFFISLES